MRPARNLPLAEPTPEPTSTAPPSPPLYALALPESHAGRLIAALAPLICPGRPLYCLDGGNCFNPYRLTSLLRRQGRSAAGLLDLIFVSRAYTCHQLTTAAETMLLPLASREGASDDGQPAGLRALLDAPGEPLEASDFEAFPAMAEPDGDGASHPPLVVALGIDYMFHDEDLPLWERRHQFDRLLGHLRQLPARGIPTVLTFSDESRNPWARSIARVARILPHPRQVIGRIERQFYLSTGRTPVAFPPPSPHRIDHRISNPERTQPHAIDANAPHPALASGKGAPS